MHVSCIQAGTLLARLGRPEVSNCIAGLEQYSYSYEEAGDQANEMRRLYNQVRAGEVELNYMATVAPRVVVSPSHAMLVDGPLNGPNSGIQPVRSCRQIFMFLAMTTHFTPRRIHSRPRVPLHLPYTADDFLSLSLSFLVCAYVRGTWSSRYLHLLGC